MSDKKNFRVEYPKGYIEVNIGKFFGTANQKNINKLLCLAKCYCSEQQRIKLIEDMRYESKYRKEILDTLGDLEFKRKKLLANFFNFYNIERPLSTPEKALVKQCEKLTKNIQRISKERWNC
jgi:hypothetical protein